MWPSVISNNVTLIEPWQSMNHLQRKNKNCDLINWIHWRQDQRMRYFRVIEKLDNSSLIFKMLPSLIANIYLFFFFYSFVTYRRIYVHKIVHFCFTRSVINYRTCSSAASYNVCNHSNRFLMSRSANVFLCSFAFLDLCRELQKNPLSLIDPLCFMYPIASGQPMTEREMRKGQ